MVIFLDYTNTTVFVSRSKWMKNSKLVMYTALASQLLLLDEEEEVLLMFERLRKIEAGF